MLSYTATFKVYFLVSEQMWSIFLCFTVNYMWNNYSYSHICSIPSILECPQLQSVGHYNHTHQHYSNLAIFSTDF